MSSWIVFGGEDQRQALMANRQQKRQPPRNTTNIVVRNGSSSNQAGPSRASQTRRRRNRRKPQQTVVRVLPNKNQGRRRNPRSPGFGNRVVVQKIVTTLGTVGSNGSGSIETELAVLLNPCTMKETTGSNTYGPVQIYASTYALFSIRSLKLNLKPLVGGSAVSGTVVRTSWNPTSNPTQMSWSALGARKHSDTTPGREGRFTLTAKDLKGPKDGWYKTNTKGDPMLCFAGSVEIHTFGETMRTYQSGQFTGGLFLAELEVVWAFKDYAQQPGLINLLKGDSTGDAKVSTDSEGRLVLDTPVNSELARAARSTTTASEIIWMVTDAIVSSATSLFPPPFNWLLKGGWWFLKKIGGAPGRASMERFMIYASINDARASAPCVSTTPNAGEISVGQLHFQQVTPGNTGVGPDIPTVRAIEYPPQPTPPSNPTQVYVTSSTMLKPGTQEEVPSACLWYNKDGGQNHGKGVGFEFNGTKVASFTVHRVAVHTDVGPATIDMFTNKVQFKIYNENGTTAFLGQAVASTYAKANDSPNIWMSHVLVYVETSRTQAYSSRWDITKATYPTETYGFNVTTQKAAGTSNLYINMRQGEWYIVVYAVFGSSLGSYKVGESVIATKGNGQVHNGTKEYHLQSNHLRTGLFPAYMTGLTLTPFTSSSVTYDGTLRDGELDPEQATYELDPSFGCDDSFEFPPPPSEEDLADDEDEFEDPEDLEEDEDEELELGPDDDYSDPPISRLVVVPEAQQLYEQLRATFPEREARLAVNQLNPSGEYAQFTAAYHNALVDGLSPRDARAFALGL